MVTSAEVGGPAALWPEEREFGSYAEKAGGVVVGVVDLFVFFCCSLVKNGRLGPEALRKRGQALGPGNTYFFFKGRPRRCSLYKPVVWFRIHGVGF